MGLLHDVKRDVARVVLLILITSFESRQYLSAFGDSLKAPFTVSRLSVHWMRHVRMIRQIWPTSAAEMGVVFFCLKWDFSHSFAETTGEGAVGEGV